MMKETYDVRIFVFAEPARRAGKKYREDGTRRLEIPNRV
jgi:hypothetical protein